MMWNEEREPESEVAFLVCLAWPRQAGVEITGADFAARRRSLEEGRACVSLDDCDARTFVLTALVLSSARSLPLDFDVLKSALQANWHLT